jgi:hypothetical protein
MTLQTRADNPLEANDLSSTYAFDNAFYSDDMSGS